MQKDIEGVKDTFVLKDLLRIRDLSWQALDVIHKKIQPGLKESEATKLANDSLKDLGVKIFWHKTHVRFGQNTLNYFNVPSEQDLVLQPNDIYFVDIGPSWDGYEGDVGDTYVVGENPEYIKIKTDVKSIFENVKQKWKTENLSGQDLYRFAESEAKRMGWLLHLDVKGHRLGDFPHTLFYKGNLGDINKNPKAYAWVLEIQIRHPSKNFGAFYEDLLF